MDAGALLADDLMHPSDTKLGGLPPEPAEADVLEQLSEVPLDDEH